MGAALYIVVEREIAGFDPFVNGNALAKVESKLAELACDLRVTNLMDFFSSDPDEAAAHMKDEGIDASHIALPPVTWFDADVGLATVTALVQHISDHPDALLNSDLVLSDLAEFKTVFLRLKIRMRSLAFVSRLLKALGVYKNRLDDPAPLGAIKGKGNR